jgi:hypothetical protein
LNTVLRQMMNNLTWSSHILFFWLLSVLPYQTGPRKRPLRIYGYSFSLCFTSSFQ